MNEPNTPMAYLLTAGAAADPVTRLGWGLGLVSVFVVLVIGVLLTAAIFRRRDLARSAANDALLRPRRIEMRWIYIGTGISAAILFACAVWTLETLAAVAKPRTTPRLTVEVRGYQYWWRVRYLDANGAVVATTANEIHLPVGEPVLFRLSSGDVIHSFWVPSLAGKMDAIPGQTNVTWLEASRAGRYRGQCGEYCGAQHAHMALFVDAEEPAAFARWLDAQKANTATQADATGAALFRDRCGACHAVRGTEARGALAPDLTHLMTRRTIAAGTLPNDAANLREWIVHTQQVKPGSEMPVVPLKAAELDSIADYLVTLH